MLRLSILRFLIICLVFIGLRDNVVLGAGNVFSVRLVVVQGGWCVLPNDGRVGSVVLEDWGVSWLAHIFRIGFWVILFVCIFFGVRNVLSELPNALVSGMIPTESPRPVLSTVSPAYSSVVSSDVSILGTASTVSVVSTVAPIREKVEDDKILGFVRGGVITQKGILRKDDHIIVDGDKDFVSSVDVKRRILYLGSGKKVQK